MWLKAPIDGDSISVPNNYFKGSDDFRCVNWTLAPDGADSVTDLVSVIFVPFFKRRRKR